MDRGPIYFLAVALGGVLLWLIYRRGMGLRGRMVLLACALAIAAAIAVLLGL